MHAWLYVPHTNTGVRPQLVTTGSLDATFCRSHFRAPAATGGAFFADAAAAGAAALAAAGFAAAAGVAAEAAATACLALISGAAALASAGLAAILVVFIAAGAVAERLTFVLETVAAGDGEVAAAFAFSVLNAAGFLSLATLLSLALSAPA